MEIMIRQFNQPRRNRGLTVIELVITLAVAAILLGGAVPSFISTLQKSRINEATSNLHVSLNLARGEAIKRRSAIKVCPSVGGTSCDTSDIDWSLGWIVIVWEPLAGEVIRRVDSNSIHGSVEIDVDNALANGVQFNPTGDVATGGEFRICHDNSSVKSRLVGVALIGRVETRDRDLSNCGTGDA